MVKGWVNSSTIGMYKCSGNLGYLFKFLCAHSFYGAGEFGAQLAIALLNGNEYMPVALIDDNRELRRNTIHGNGVEDAPQLESVIEKFEVRRILLAIPRATAERPR
jgi:FlaA1/EpsC-like NDP-sugar epimerase